MIRGRNGVEVTRTYLVLNELVYFRDVFKLRTASHQGGSLDIKGEVGAWSRKRERDSWMWREGVWRC